MSPTLENLLLALPLAPRPPSAYFDKETFVQQNGLVPADYLRALSKYQAGEGAVGAAYLALWEPAEVYSLNADYEVAEFAPGFTIFGSDGGGTAFAFEQTTGSIYSFAFIGMTLDEPAIFWSQSLEGFVQKLAAEPSI